jgi:hypothetical protein
VLTIDDLRGEALKNKSALSDENIGIIIDDNDDAGNIIRFLEEYFDEDSKRQEVEVVSQNKELGYLKRESIGSISAMAKVEIGGEQLAGVSHPTFISYCCPECPNIILSAFGKPPQCPNRKHLPVNMVKC